MAFDPFDVSSSNQNLGLLQIKYFCDEPYQLGGILSIACVWVDILLEEIKSVLCRHYAACVRHLGDSVRYQDAHLRHRTFVKLVVWHLVYVYLTSSQHSAERAAQLAHVYDIKTVFPSSLRMIMRKKSIEWKLLPAKLRRIMSM